MRLFVAVDLDEAAHRSLDGALDPVRGKAGAPRWSSTSLWHVTLVFLGEVADDRVDRVCDEQASAAADANPFTLRLAGAGTFGGRGGGRTLWVGVDGDTERLAALARATRRAARSAGVPVERRPYRAHLTVGRWRPTDEYSPDLVERLAGYEGPPFAVDRLAVVRSYLGPRPRHEPIATVPLEP